MSQAQERFFSTRFKSYFGPTLERAVQRAERKANFYQRSYAVVFFPHLVRARSNYGKKGTAWRTTPEEREILAHDPHFPEKQGWPFSVNALRNVEQELRVPFPGIILYTTSWGFSSGPRDLLRLHSMKRRSTKKP